MISVCSSVRAPRATSHTFMSMPDDSSNIRTMRLPWLCRSANASVLLTDHVTRSARKDLSCTFIVVMSAVAVDLNQLEVTDSSAHIAMTGRVLVSKGTSLFEVVTRSDECRGG